jgi:hypothetical protein
MLLIQLVVIVFKHSVKGLGFPKCERLDEKHRPKSIAQKASPKKHRPKSIAKKASPKKHLQKSIAQKASPKKTPL